LKKAEGSLAKWVEGSWKNINEVSAGIESNELRITGGIKEEGFFRLQFTLEAPERRLFDLETYAIVSDNWKRDILAFCRELKEQVETDPDPKLIFSSIAVSHVDHTMEIVSEASFLSGKILKALSDAVWSKEKFEAGECPDLVIGLNKIRLKRFEGAEIAEFVVFVPETYDSSLKSPLYLFPDARRFHPRRGYSQRSGLIDMWWHFPFPIGYDWKDYKYMLSIMKGKLSLDEDRFYLYGHCGNGFASVALALTHPDHWAECDSVFGNSHLYLAGNALNLPLIFVKGGHEETALEAWYEFAVKCFQYGGCRHLKYSRIQEVVPTRGTSVPEAIRDRHPRRVQYTVESLHNASAYWVTILGREDENIPATIDAFVDGQTVTVKTRNVAAYSLDLVRAPLESDGVVEIIENDRSLRLEGDAFFTRQPEAYTNATYVKNDRLSGPVWDAFSEPYVVIYGTGGEDRNFSHACEEVARLLAKDGPCFADVEIPKELVDNHNLVLIGTAASNAWLARISEQLPAKIEGGVVVANGRYYDRPDTGLILIYPNPLAPERYAAVFASTSSIALARIPEAYSQMKSAQAADVGIFEITHEGAIVWRVIEKFSTVWNWHDKWDEVLAITTQRYHKWQWRQWIVRVLREQLKADVAICGVPFRFSSVMLPYGQITYRNLWSSVKNSWMLRIQLDGRSLKQLLARQLRVPTQAKIRPLVLDGVTLSLRSTDVKDKSICVDEIESDRKYTVVFDRNILTEARIAMALKDYENYELVGDAHLLPVLRSYLREQRYLNIDAQLGDICFNAF
jgi:pimeloyl-ACP methyl ester carboxylesterase